MLQSDKLKKQVVEMKYLNADNVERYRLIMRIFFVNYEKLRYWLYQEEVYQAVLEAAPDMEYRMEQCQQDLAALTEWKNLLTIQDTRKVNTIQDFKNKNFRYQMSEYSVEIERLVIRLENLFIEGASLEPTLMERIRKSIEKMEGMANQNPEEVYTWWNDLNNDFVRLHQNYQDYIRDLNSVKAEEMMKSKDFLLFKDKLIDYLRTFIKGLQRNVGVIESYLQDMKLEIKEEILEKIVAYELSIPRVDTEVTMEMLEEKNRGRYESIEDWFVGRDGQDNEAGKLFDATNEIIRRITRYAAQLSEKSALRANRREEYRKVMELFLACGDLDEAHKMAAMVFGIEKPYHLKGNFHRETESMNSSVYQEEPLEIVMKPMVRTYREKMKRSHIVDRSKEKEQVRQEMLKQLRQEQQRLQELMEGGQIDFAALPVIEPRIREILLKWLSDAFEDVDYTGRTEEGRGYHLDMSNAKETCVVHCEDGCMTMPQLRIIFDEERAE